MMICMDGWMDGWEDGWMGLGRQTRLRVAR